MVLVLVVVVRQIFNTLIVYSHFLDSFKRNIYFLAYFSDSLKTEKN